MGIDSELRSIVIVISEIRMEIVCKRFPHLAENIFDKVDYQSLVKCTEVSKNMNKFLETRKVLWKQMIIKRITGNLEVFVFKRFQYVMCN